MPGPWPPAPGRWPASTGGLSPYPPPAYPQAGGPDPRGWDTHRQAPDWLARTDNRALPERGRPRYREPLPVRPRYVVFGLLGGLLWMMLLGGQGVDARWYAWLSILGGLLTGGTSAVLVRIGDRGVAVGAALAAAIGVTITAIVVVVRWIGGDWLLW